MGKIYPHPQWKDTGDSKETIDDEPALVTKLEVGDTSTHITKDGDGNMVFTDAVTGELTLAELEGGGGGGVDTSGTPVDNDYAKFTDADTIEGRSYTEVKQDLSLEDSDINTLITATKLDDLTAPDDNTDLDASAAKHGLMPKADSIKLAAIEAGATVYPDTGEQAFLDADLAKLDGIEAGADVTGSNAPQAHASTHDSGGSDQVHSLADDDDDTKIQVEESADEDIIRMDVAGTERLSLGDAAGNITADHWLFGSPAGIIGYPNQSHASIYLNTTQPIPTGFNRPVALDTETTDTQNEFDSSQKTGTADENTLNHLVDDGNSQFASGDVGATVWNTDDGTFATVTVFNDAGDLTLSADIFPLGTENYTLYWARFTVTEDGVYLVSGVVAFDDVSDYDRTAAKVLKNGSTVAFSDLNTSTDGTVDSYPSFAATIPLVVDDYLQLAAYHSHGSNINLRIGNNNTKMVITKIL